MIVIDVFGEIGSKSSEIWMSAMGLPFEVLSMPKVKEILDAHPDDPDVTLNIDCVGGDVAEGFKIYDFLRSSGKNIYTNIVGGCHSMAVVLLLAAPLENRTGSRNLRALIHKVYGMPFGYMTADDCVEMAEDLFREQNAILDIYAERTGKDRAFLENIMSEEKERTADELLEWGFIGKITSYNTNLKNKFNKMSKKNSMFSGLGKKIQDMKNKMNGKVVNYDFKDTSGNVVFRTDKDDDSLEVGDRVELMGDNDGGIFPLEDGRIVTIDDGVITKIEKTEPESLTEAVNALFDLVETVINKQSEDQAANVSAFEDIRNGLEKLATDIRNGKGSNYSPSGRIGGPATKGGKDNSYDAMKAKAQELREQFVNGGKVRQ